MGQLVSTDGNTNMFKCLLCNSIAWHPKITMCCQRVFCGPCLDQWLQTSAACPQCQAQVLVGDGSTGGCGEQRVKRLDQHSTGVQAVLWRVYGNLRVRCAHSCGWSGDVFSYEQHVKGCRAGMASPKEVSSLVTMKQSSKQQPVRQQPQQQQQQQPHQQQQPQQQKSSELSDFIGGSHVIVRAHTAGDDTQLTLQCGDIVSVQQVAAHGWVYGRRTSSGSGRSEGWFPSFCLPEQRPPPPQQSPPPMSPPAGSTKVMRDYEASDPAQLSVKEGELVYVRQRDQSGWTFVLRVSTQGTGKREGWVPDWLLRHDG